MSDVKYIDLFSEASEWLNQNYDDLRRRYGGKFIALRGRHVIAFDDDLEALFEKLASMNVDLNEVLVEFIPGEDTEYIL